MTQLASVLNQEAAKKKAADERAAAAAKAKAEAPPKELVNLRNIRPRPQQGEAGSLLFMPSLDSPGFELKAGDNWIDTARITPIIQAQLVDWINAGWLEALPAEVQP